MIFREKKDIFYDVADRLIYWSIVSQSHKLRDVWVCFRMVQLHSDDFIMCGTLGPDDTDSFLMELSGFLRECSKLS